ncbi:WXG100 family type VII secretion target, partial [Amycolatopsis tucumanensis]|nr:WXG100 family type VII secretion target [Amycolatopsis tucumanensis]
MSEYKPGDVGLHMAEKWQTGAGFFDAAVSLNEAVKENDKVAIGIGSAGLALETLGLALDPIGSLLTAGIGWLIEHISVLRWPLDIMWGDPEGIAAAEEAVKAEKEKLEQWAQEHQTKLATLMESWSGEGADQFRKSMEAVTDQLNAIGGYLENAGKSMKVAGGLVGAFRGIARDLIAMLLATIIKGALIAAALAPVTFGASIAIFIGTTIGMVATALGKIGAKIAELTRKLVDLGASLSKLGKAGDDLAGAKPPSVKPGSSGPAPANTGAPVSNGPKLNDPPPAPAAGPKPADAAPVSGGPKLNDPPAAPVVGPKPADAAAVSTGPKLNDPPAAPVVGPKPADV